MINATLSERIETKTATASMMMTVTIAFVGSLRCACSVSPLSAWRNSRHMDEELVTWQPASQTRVRRKASQAREDGGTATSKFSR